MADSNALVIDNGSGLMKVGWAGSDNPVKIFPSYVGVPKVKQTIFSKKEAVQSGSDKYCGDKATSMQRKIHFLQLSYPITHGQIENAQDMKVLWDNAYALLEKPSEDHPVLLTETPLNPDAKRRAMLKTFFEGYNVPAAYVKSQAVLALYASGRKTGVVVDSGHGVTSCVPIFEGFAIPRSVKKIKTTGSDVTEYLRVVLKKHGINLHAGDFAALQNIKETMCQVAPNAGGTSSVDPGTGRTTLPPKATFQLPDGKNIIKFEMNGRLQTQPTEILFDSTLAGAEAKGVQNCVADAISECDLNLRSDLYASIVLSGGSTMFKGYGRRLMNELHRIRLESPPEDNEFLSVWKAAHPRDTKVKVFAAHNRKISTWVGGSLLASLESFKDMWITKEYYQENGAARC